MHPVLGELLRLLDLVVERANTGQAVEAYGIDETETRIKAYDGAVETLSSARTRGIGIRVIDGGRVGYAYSADLSEAALAETLDEARRNATTATPDEANVLAAADEPLPDIPALWHPEFEEVTPAQKVAAAIELEQAVRRTGPPVTGVNLAFYGDSASTAAIASTAGVRGAYRRCDAYVLAETLATTEGATASAYGLDFARTLGDLDVERAAAESVERARRLLGGRKPASARMSVLLDPFATASFLGVLAGALTAEAVRKGRSLFAGRLGERVAGAHITLVDDGTLIDGLATAPWDGEGVRTRRTPLISAGHLTGWLHNTYSAVKDGTASTGNARRSGFKSVPAISPSNLFFAPGDQPPEALLAAAGTAFYCQQILGVHSGANPITGDFSVGAAGLMVRGGQLAEPVREAVIAGTIPDMLGGITAVGADLRFLPFSGGMGGVTLLIEGMTLAGQ